MDWTDDEIDTLTLMKAQGNSAALIAERLGTSRNAVLGKLFRLGLSTPQAPAAVVRARAARPFAREEFRKPVSFDPPPPKIENAKYNITGPRSGRIEAQLTKHELRRMLTQAVENTAKAQNN